MKREEKQAMEAYEAPRVEVIEVEVERGFEASVPGYRNGGSYDE